MGFSKAFTQTIVQNNCCQKRQCLPQAGVSKVQIPAPFSLAQSSIAGQSLRIVSKTHKTSRHASSLIVYAIKDGATLDRPLRVAVVGGGPAGACTAETLAKNGIETFLFERKLDNCKVNPLYFCLERRCLHCFIVQRCCMKRFWYRLRN